MSELIVFTIVIFLGMIIGYGHLFCIIADTLKDVAEQSKSLGSDFESTDLDGCKGMFLVVDQSFQVVKDILSWPNKILMQFSQNVIWITLCTIGLLATLTLTARLTKIRFFTTYDPDIKYVR